MTWEDAQKYCESIGGSLAMPKTEDEVLRIGEIAGLYGTGYLWIGGTTTASELANASSPSQARWTWADGTEISYKNWDSGKPDDTAQTEIRLAVNASPGNGKWEDLADNYAAIKGLICEKTNDLELIQLSVKDVSFSDGVIILNDSVSENDDIIASYTYIEEYYVYRGYWRNKADFVRVDLNPNKYHTYSDPVYTPSETKPSKNLFNKVIYFFMKPTVEYEVPQDYDDLIYDEANDAFADFKETYSTEGGCLYHQIDNYEPLDKHDIYIGSVFIRQNSSLHSTILTDARTRGGGVIEGMKDNLRQLLQEETEFYLDIGYYDGKPYQENGVIIIRLDKKILKEFGGRFDVSDVEKRVKDWMGYGNYPIIEYVDAFSENELPQQTLTIEDEYLNIIDYDPEFFVECVEETEYNEDDEENGEEES